MTPLGFQCLFHAPPDKCSCQRFDEAEGQLGILGFAYDITGFVQARMALAALPHSAPAAQ